MQSKLNTILVYDLETGGFNSTINPITEMAGVAVSVETLEIIEEFSIMLKPRLDLSFIDEDPTKEAKLVFTSLGMKDEETKIKSLKYKGKTITLKSLESLSADIEKFSVFLNQRVKNLGAKGFIFEYSEYLELLDTDFKDIAEIYLNYCYHPQALEVTHLSIETLVNEGVSYEEAFIEIEKLILRHTSGNKKPVVAGHNIEEFDNSFMIKLFSDNKKDFLKSINSFRLDTLNFAHLRWFEMSSFSLGVCANELGLTLKEAHRALPDTVANAKFLISMLRSLRGEGSQQVNYTRRKFNFNF